MRARTSAIALLASALLLALTTSFGASQAFAQPPEPDTAVGYATDGMPGFGNVAVPRVDPWRVAVGGTASFGYTEDVLGAGDSHLRLGGRLAGAFKIIPNLTLALRLDGRYDSHSSDAGSDDGLVGDPRLALRGAYESDGLLLGGQLTAWLPGEDAPSIVFDALSVDAKLMAGYQAGDLTVAANVGFRLDQSDSSATGANRLSPSDRISLGVSSSNALLLGVGVGYRLGTAELFGEWSWDMLIGDQAPDAGQAPMRVGLGGRMFLVENALQLELGVDVGVSGRAEPDVLATGAALFPVEPRFGAHAGLMFRFPEPERPVVVAEPEECTLTCGENQRLNAEACTCEDVAPPAPTTGNIEGAVTDEQSQPIAGATVALAAPAPTDGSALPEGTPPAATATTDAQGHFTMANVAPGTANLTVTADGYLAQTITATVTAGATATANATMRADLPQGQLRGVVQSFNGQPLQATIRVDPIGTTATADAEGAFQIDVPPGTYQVTITAQGYTEQTRSVTVEERGVTVLNVDMRRAGRGGR